MSALQLFLYTFWENVALWVKYQARDHAFMFAWITAWSGGWGKAAKVLTNDRVTSTVEDLYEEFYFNIQHREANSFTDL